MTIRVDLVNQKRYALNVMPKPNLLTKRDFEKTLSKALETTKKDFDNTLYDALEEHSKAIIEAVDFGFQKANERFDSVESRLSNVENRLSSLENRLSSLERRMFAVEEILTEHGKELRKIKKILAQLQQQKKVDHEKLILLEKRTARLETAAAAM